MYQSKRIRFCFGLDPRNQIKAYEFRKTNWLPTIATVQQRIARNILGGDHPMLMICLFLLGTGTTLDRIWF